MQELPVPRLRMSERGSLPGNGRVELESTRPRPH